MASGKFATAIYCIDGRTQGPLIKWVRRRARVDYVDLVTEPGVDKALSQGSDTEIAAIRTKVEVSARAHHSRLCGTAVYSRFPSHRLQSRSCTDDRSHTRGRRTLSL
jgi:hypothetical protein